MTLAASLRAVRNLPEDTTGDIAEKKTRLAAAKSERKLWSWRVAADLYIAAFLLPKKDAPREPGTALVPTTDHVWRALSGGQVYGPLVGAVREITDSARVFHWPLEFPDLMAAGGFEVVIGNPPWERIKLQEQEFFAAREPDIAMAATADARGKMIGKLKDALEGTRERRLYEAFEQAKRTAEASSIFAREAGRFPLTGRGDLNTYALFAELACGLIKGTGRSGIIVPSGVVTDYSTSKFFGDLVNSRRLASALGFDNQKRLFPSVHPDTPFTLLTTGHTSENPVFSAYLLGVGDLSDSRRLYALSPENIRTINPNTQTAPVFRSRADADLTARVYSRVPVLFDASDPETGDPWSFDYMTKMFDMADNSGEFKNSAQCLDAGFSRSNSTWFDANRRILVPVYEAKMIHIFDHRWATFDGTAFRDSLESEKAQDFEATPRYWLPAGRVKERLKTKNWERDWLMGWRDITNATNERTVISAVYPAFAVGHTIRNLFVGVEPSLAAAFLACLSTLVFDYLARQKLGGTHLTVEILQQLPVIPPQSYGSADLSKITSLVLELCFTSQSMSGFARDLGFDGPPFRWDEARRALLRAELDAWYAHAYGLTRDELRYILDPADVMGEDYPSETFRVLKNNEMKEFGEYRTRRLVLEAWDRMAVSEAAPAASVGPPYPVGKALVDPADLADGAWAASSDSGDAALAQLAALVKALPGPTPIARVRLAALFALEPRHMTRRLSGPDRVTWLRLVGTAARLPQGANIASFAPKINANWQSAVTQLRGMGAILQDASAQTWAPGSRVHDFVTETWPDGRAAFVLRALESLSLADATSYLQPEDREWVEAYAA
jgi:hypothetical protein